MNCFEKILYWLQGTMERPTPFGWFHLMWIGLTILSVIVLFKIRNKYNDKQLKMVLGIYGVVAFVLELIKQVIWSFNFENGIVTWDYQWYAAPFQLCTTPIFVSLICLFLKNNKVRKSLLSYMAFITILGGFITILIPESCFVETIEINIHTMWLHCGSFVVSIYLLVTSEVELNLKSLKNSFCVFLIFVSISQLLNISIYHSGLLNGETFNIFYISPYFISTLPVFDIIQQHVPYIIYLIIYIVTIALGSGVVYVIAKIIQLIYKRRGNNVR